jgi:TRAP-type mannitol/chloroaromatic compound transport system substrate-binding protein
VEALSSEEEERMERRQFLSLAAKGAFGAAALAACSTGDDDLDGALQADDLPTLNWEMATSWPTNLDTIFGGAQTVAARVTAMTGGKFTINARAGGELVPGLEVLQNIQSNSIDIGHTASYYYRGLAEVNAFGTAVPFGLTARQQNGWLYYGGGLEMLQEIYAERFNAIQFPAGNTGVQMGGWFNKEINSLADIQGLRFRIPGLGGVVMSELGAAVQQIAGGEIFQSLQTGAIDAAEWVGPYDDLQLEFNTVADFYYYPGWWEPGPTLEVQIPLEKWNELPEEYQEVIKTASAQANVDMMASYDAKNPGAFQEIIADGSTQVLPFPDDVLNAAEEAAFGLYDQLATEDTDFKSVYDSFNAYRRDAQQWFAIAEQAMLTYESVV